MNDDTNRLTFAPIDLAKHAALCARFRADSFRSSFGTDERFYQEYGDSPTTVHPDGRARERYWEWLARRMADFPGSGVHVWQGEEIIGQIEMGRFRHDPSIGYVNLYYLIPGCQGRGLGGQLDAYAVAVLHRAGHRLAQLSVSRTNHQALAFYKKHHWIDLGPRTDHPETHYMEKELVPAVPDPGQSDPPST